jgi:hypothetical protein
METNHPKVPEPGPPKKGFWGFLASFFPKRPSVLTPPSPTGEVPSVPNTDEPHDPKENP